MAEQLLHSAYVVTSLQQVCGEGMAQDMVCNRLVYSVQFRCLAHSALHAGLIQVMTTTPERGSIERTTEGNTPTPFDSSVGARRQHPHIV
jgi:hypothetical protein